MPRFDFAEETLKPFLQKNLAYFHISEEKLKRRVLVITGGVGGSCQEGPSHHRRFNIFTPNLSSREFRTQWTFSLSRTLGHLPLEVLTSDVGILRDRTLIRPSLSPRKVSSLAILTVALRPGSAVVRQDKEFKFGVSRSSVSAAWWR